MPTKNNVVLKTSDALKGFLFRAYNACRCNHVGQVLPDNKGRSLPPGGGRCPVGQMRGQSCFLRPLRSLAHTAIFSAPLVGEVRRSRVGGVIISHASSSFGEGGRSPGKGLSHGFTLIELLVVVLIIGILAAIALPQYQKAVYRSRNTQLKAILKTIRQAEDAYYLEHGQYAANFNELDIDLPLSKPGTTGSATKNTLATCSMSVAGTDSIRRGNGFDIVLNITDVKRNVAIQGIWTQNPYPCVGFNYNNTGWHCLEIGPKYGGFQKTKDYGSFCEKIEGGTLKDTNQWGARFYEIK